MTASTAVRPAFFSHPDYHYSLGPEVGELAAAAGFAPDPEQQLVLDPMFGMDRWGRSVAFEVCVVAPRQNIKTGLFKIAALGKVFLLERPLFVWSAHEFSTTAEAFRDLTILIESCPSLDRQVRQIHRASGSEAIELLGGQRIKFKARTKSGGRGLTGDDVCLDEAFALVPAHMGALLPTLSARPDPQIMYGSSAGLAGSDVLRGVRDRGRGGGDPRLLYVEWCAEAPCEHAPCEHVPGTSGCALDDPVNWQAANTALGRRISLEYVAAERRALPPVEFGRERLGWWDKPLESESVAISRRLWLSVQDVSSSAVSVAAFAVDTDIEREWTAIGAAGPLCSCVAPQAACAPGRFHVELVEQRRGTEGTVERLVELVAAHTRPGWPPPEVVVDRYGAAASLIPAMEAAGLTVYATSTSDVAHAYGVFMDALAGGTLSHGPQPALEVAVLAARTRACGDGGSAFGRRTSGGGIGPLVAVELAHWRAVTAPAADILTTIW